MKGSLSRVVNSIMLHAFVMSIALAFRIARHRDGRFRKAVASFNATYQFRTRSAVRQLIFREGRLFTRGGCFQTPDFEITYPNLPVALKHMIVDPNNVLQLLVENKIQHSGNLYYTFKLGYLLGLCTQCVRDVLPRFRPKSTVAKNAPKT